MNIKNETITMKLKENPIFRLLIRIRKGKVDAPEALRSVIRQKTDTQKQKYFLLDIPQRAQSIILNGINFSVINHHMTVYSAYKDNAFGMTSYHYTASLSEKYKLHVYYNLHGVYQHALLQDSSGANIALDKTSESTLITFANNELAQTSGSIYQLFEKLQNELSQKCSSLHNEIIRLSKQVYVDGWVTSTTTQAYHDYTKKIQQMIKLISDFNQISLQPDFSVVNNLKRTLEVIKNPPQKPKKIKVKKETVKPAKKQPSQTTSLRKKQANQNKAKQEEKRTKLLSEMLQKITDLEANKLDVPSIVELYKIYHDCFLLCSEKEPMLMLDMVIKRQQLKARAQIILAIVASSGELDHVKTLATIVSHINQKAISQAALSGHVDILKFLLRKHQGPKFFLSQVAQNLSIPLLADTRLPNNSLRALLKYGSDIEVMFPNGYTLLHQAADCGDIERAKICLEFGMDVNERQNKTSVTHILGSKDKNLDLNKVSRRMQKMSQELEGSHVEEKTPLYISARLQNMEMCQLLIAHGANPYLRNNRNFSAFSYISIMDERHPEMPAHVELCSYFVRALGCNVNCFHGELGTEQTALHFAVQYNRPDYVKMLLELGADPNIQRPHKILEQQITAFQSACNRGHLELVKLMIENSQFRLTENNIFKAIEYSRQYTNSVIFMLAEAHYIKLEEKGAGDQTQLCITYLAPEVANKSLST